MGLVLARSVRLEVPVQNNTDAWAGHQKARCKCCHCLTPHQWLIVLGPFQDPGANGFDFRIAQGR